MGSSSTELKVRKARAQILDGSVHFSEVQAGRRRDVVIPLTQVSTIETVELRDPKAPILAAGATAVVTAPPVVAAGMNGGPWVPLTWGAVGLVVLVGVLSYLLNRRAVLRVSSSSGSFHMRSGAGGLADLESFAEAVVKRVPKPQSQQAHAAPRAKARRKIAGE